MPKKMPPAGSRAIILGRYSSDKQNPKSADDQIREGREFCKRHGWTVVRTEKDEARTGRTTVGRQGFYNAMAAAEAGECDVIVVEDISRLSRDAADTLMANRKLSEVNVVICTLRGGVLDGLELALRAQIAQEQSEEMGFRIKRGHRSAAGRGRVVGNLAYGYDLLDTSDESGGNRIINEAEAKVVVRIFEDLAAGMSAHAICAALNREGVPTPGAKLWRSKLLTGDRHTMSGLGRNPTYVGKVIYGKTSSRLIASTGRKEVKPGLPIDQIITDAPHLRIISDELWHVVQDRLDKGTTTVPSRMRRPRYVLSGLIKCGRCGHSYLMINASLGCEGRHLGVCDNGRRVGREDVQDAVLGGLKDRLLQPNILDFYLEEYRSELEKAGAEQVDRSASAKDRLRDLDRQITNTLSVVKAGGAVGYAAQLLNQELEELGALRKQVERECQRAPASPPLSLEADAVVERLRALLDDLGAALHGEERDAARAREIIRSFIDQVRITPIETKAKPDGRGAGPVCVTVEGSLTALLGHGIVDREIKRRYSTLTTLYLPKFTFKYYVDIPWENGNTLPGTIADVATFRRLLDDATAPVRIRELVDVLSPARRDDRLTLDKRARNAITFLQRDNIIKAVRLGFGSTGWVRTDRNIDDEEWRRRAEVPAPLRLPLPSIPKSASPVTFLIIDREKDPNLAENFFSQFDVSDLTIFTSGLNREIRMTAALFSAAVQAAYPFAVLEPCTSRQPIAA